MANAPVVLINLLTTDAARQPALLELLQQNVDNVICRLPGWIATRLVASSDGTRVLIYSEWASGEAVAGMRTDPAMMAYFPKIQELARFESIPGRLVHHRQA